MLSPYLVSVFAALVRPLVVALVHLPLLVVVILSTPLWILAGVLPKSHGKLALQFLKYLRSWSAELSIAVGGEGNE
ncbi:hypothetical protein Ato02nite_089520 [Paractinoplanes toevensis]|uniref:Uncharacterized protein n=1 Tax=Paractinoplanes toevensis TaxID=571911 RepID=A0A919WBH2_9ACTN|nr:hypothetical protein Ato02nite_089520 [Actinoplanes toevensis]